MNSIEAFHIFYKDLQNGKEGVFWSECNELKKENWIYGVGDKQVADFEKGPFPLFSTFDFMGTKKHHWHFKKWKKKKSQIPNSKSQNSNYIFPNSKSTIQDSFTTSNETKQSFCKKIMSVKNFQKAGDMWVLNLAHTMSGRYENEYHLLSLYANFLKKNRIHANGVVWTNKLKFISFSPEIFIRQNGSQIITCPIKGTGKKTELKESEKEITELHMITDLLRNDLAQIATNVNVEKKRYLTNEGDFFHARAKISAHLKKTVLREGEYRKLLPAGSISGAPKSRVLEEIIKQESSPRNFFCGTFGVKFDANHSIFNILIRTLFLNNGKWKFPVGSGITVESNPEREWNETIQKFLNVIH